MPRPASILIVEDEQIVALDLQQTLREFGYDPYAIAPSADAAVARAAERCPDLVLMDIRIKGARDGVEAAAILRERFGVPVVFLTAHADEGTVDRAKRVEPFGYLLKPIKAAELHSVVEVALYKHGMERHLRERERWFSTTLRSIADAVITVDTGGRVTFMNSVAEALTGVKADVAEGRAVGEVLQIAEQASGGESPVLAALRERRGVSLQEGSLRNLTSGDLRVISDSAAPVLADGQTLGAVMVFRDVTEQKRIQKQLELADRLASLGTMAAGVAHEVNNPLAAVVANAGFLAEELNAAAVDGFDGARVTAMLEALQDIQSGARRIGRIVSDLRAFSRPPSGAVGDVDLGRCVEWALRTTAHEFRHRARVRRESQDTPRVRADETRLGQVLINLLVNAAHAIAPGDAERNEVVVVTRTDAAGRAVVEVRDTGAGIPPDALERIFDPFFTTKPVGEGTGLGLSICHGIVTSLGGEIRVESAVGRGTSVYVTLPAASPRTLQPAPATGPSAAVRGRILLVDDEEMVLRALRRILSAHELECVTSAKEALARIDAGPPFDLIVTDLMMPTMTGMEFYEALLARDPELARRTVFMTGGSVTAQTEAFFQSVPNVRIEKPFEVGAIQRLVHELLLDAAATPP